MSNRSDELGLIDGRYRLIRELGAGAFGSVHRATQVVLGKNLRDVALKLFRAEVINEDNVATQMNDALAIIELLSQCTDWEIRQHFLTIYDMGLTQESPRRAYIAMELVSEGSLSGRMKQVGRFTLAGALHYLAQLVRALSFMHQNRFVHSDIKPDNVLLFRHGGHDHVKVGDFGLAGKHRGILGDGPRGGDMAYIAPELLDGLAATPAADLFSTGVMLWEMITGTNPYGRVGKSLSSEERADKALMQRLRRDYRREPLRLKRQDFPEIGSGKDATRFGLLLDVINRMLEPDLDKRYRSAVDVQRDLSNVSEMGQSPDSRTPAGRGDPVSGPSDDTHDESIKLINRYRSQWESFVGLKNWTEAQRIADELIASCPENADGYLLLSETSLKQADEFVRADSPTAEKRVRAFRRQASRPLAQGLNKCNKSSEQRQLKLALANIHELLGDSATADQLRRVGSGITSP